MTLSLNRPWSVREPQSAPSAAILTGSGWTLRSVIPNAFRRLIQTIWSAKRCARAVSKPATTEPARLLVPFLGLASFSRLLLHAARLDLGPPLEPFQPRDLLAQPGVLRPKTRVPFKKPQNQLLEVPKTKTINIWARPGHSRIESQNPPIWESSNSKKSPGLLPLLPPNSEVR